MIVFTGLPGAAKSTMPEYAARRPYLTRAPPKPAPGLILNSAAMGMRTATTAEWARLMRPSGRRLFYSTSRTNHSSQAVAARLGLRQIGRLWQLRRMTAESGWTDPPVRSSPSTIEGSGVYASAPIRAGDVVFVCVDAASSRPPSWARLKLRAALQHCHHRRGPEYLVGCCRRQRQRSG